MIIQNAVKYRKKIYLSKSRHDFVWLTKKYYIDGGVSYFRGCLPEKGIEYLGLTGSSTIKDIFDKLICERLLKLWKDLTIDEIKEERSNIHKAYRTRKKQWAEYSEFTRHHALLHLYVGGYWIVQKHLKENI